MKIKLHPTGQELEGDPNKTVLQICLENKVELKSLCKGIPSCAECRVKVLAGEHNLIPPTKIELNLIGTSYYIDGRRLACQLRAFGDVSLDITEHLQRDDLSAKKVRGYRGKTLDSKAVQDVLMLDAEKRAAQPAAPDPAKKP